jgi:hypothetical protein
LADRRLLACDRPIGTLDERLQPLGLAVATVRLPGVHAAMSGDSGFEQRPRGPAQHRASKVKKGTVGER